MSTQYANPAPLGLCGFGMTTILLNIHNAGFFDISAVILAMGLCYGGLAQVLVGLMEFRRGNTFGTLAFTSYGLFWWSLVLIWVLPVLGLTEASPHSFVGWYLLLWGIFTLCLFFGTLKGAFIGKFVFGSLTTLFFLLAYKDFTGNASVGIFAGYVGIICGASAIYEAIGLTLNEKYGREVIPMGEPKQASVQVEAVLV
ncbi:acetate uptake transporter [Parendozoicomonas haliclonae]|uniref:Inner membrane protein YaaH n=1 Tax=Parendozoicomonas haliclonae TaxID=1960125 RepID=A0A1X7AK58_9GAMM|nr:GPR1/FUN34/YaaH family transporter [Parendozoicomonas haliclonae]SMA47518.1 Inner membrane protein YaaH [Parendozoicomonas haliclonae]